MARDDMVHGGRFGLSFRRDRHGQIFVAPWLDRERFLAEGIGIAPIEAADPVVEAFLLRNARSPLSYGYPLCVDPSGMVAPLLFSEVTLRCRPEGPLQVIKAPHRRPRLHHHLLLEAGLDSSSIAALVERIERGRFASFDDCLAELAACLGIDPARFRPGALGRWPGDAAAPGWYNVPVLYLSPPDATQALMLEELDRLDAAFAAADAPTALHAMVTPPAEPARIAAVPAIEAFAVTEGVATVLDRCLASGTAVIEAPPGSGRLSLIANLVASMIVDGQSVLYVASNAAAADRLAMRFQSLVNWDQDWIVRLGADNLRQRLVDTIARLALGVDEPPRPPAEGVTLRQIAELRKAVTAARRQIEPIRKAHRHLFSRQRWRRSQAAGLPHDPASLFDPAHRLDSELDRIEVWHAQARALGRGSGADPTRWIKRRIKGAAVYDTLINALTGAIRPLPAAPRQALLDMVRNRITDADGFDRLAEAFDQLARFSLWQKALAGEQQAFDMVVQSPAADAVDQQINEAQAAAIRASRLLLRESWRAAITADLGRLAERLNALFGLIEQRRQHPESRCNPKAERTLASAVSGLTRPLPLWTAPADLVPAVLPLTDSLFDLVIVDEADRLSAAAIMPLLVRGRRAMVFGSLIEPGSARSDGFALMLAGAGAIPFRLDEHLRSHAAIGDYLSHAFHGGALRIHSDHLALRPGFSSAQLGLHWHHVETADPAETDDASTGDPEIDGALKLVAGWCEAGVLGGTERVTVGIVTPVMDALPALAQGIAEILPAKPAQERIVLGPPERFETQPVDLLVVLPRIAAGMPARHARYLAANRTLYHEAVGAARIGVHIVGDEQNVQR